jgi:mannose-6-phosphate isomerase-like protein (cupin superfamily)
MYKKKIVAMVITIACLVSANMILTIGCSTNKGDVMVSAQKKACIIDLEPDCEYQKLLQGRPQTRGMRSGRVCLQPGQSIGEHSTGQHEEVLVFLSGRGSALVGDNDILEIGEGKIAYIPPNTTHNMKNTADEPLIYIYCVAPVNSPD